ncbi:MAG: hypothetical protein JWR07_4085 [Nevskia sp.]|nr:hypothetical protein [Nevskia sp.]
MDFESAQHEDTLQVCGLEYDVGGLGTTEASPAEENQAASLLVHYVPGAV